MELRQFISRTLLDIIGGVEDAQSKTPPDTIAPGGISTRLSVVESGYTHIQIVDFEVTVRADEQAAGDPKVNVVSAVFGENRSPAKHEHSAILRFKVPVMLPTKHKQ